MFDATNYAIAQIQETQREIEQQARENAVNKQLQVNILKSNNAQAIAQNIQRKLIEF